MISTYGTPRLEWGGWPDSEDFCIPVLLRLGWFYEFGVRGVQHLWLVRVYYGKTDSRQVSSLFRFLQLEIVITKFLVIQILTNARNLSISISN